MIYYGIVYGVGYVITALLFGYFSETGNIKTKDTMSMFAFVALWPVVLVVLMTFGITMIGAYIAVKRCKATK